MSGSVVDPFSLLRARLSGAGDKHASDKDFFWNDYCDELQLNAVEARLLRRYGWRCASLWIGESEPQDSQDHTFLEACKALSGASLRESGDPNLRILGPAWIRFLRRWRYESELPDFDEAQASQDSEPVPGEPGSRSISTVLVDDGESDRKCRSCGETPVFVGKQLALTRGRLFNVPGHLRSGIYCELCLREKCFVDGGLHPSTDNPNDGYNHMPEGQRWGNGKLH